MSENLNPQLKIAACDDEPIDCQQAAAPKRVHLFIPEPPSGIVLNIA